MGARKRIKAEANREARKTVALASLKNCSSSPRKMRLVADQIRGVNVEKALYILKLSSKDASSKMEKLVMSALANWETKNEGSRMEDANLIVKEVQVDSARMLKRIQAAPQGRAHRIRKRSNHVTVIVASKED